MCVFLRHVVSARHFQYALRSFRQIFLIGTCWGKDYLFRFALKWLGLGAHLRLLALSRQ